MTDDDNSLRYIEIEHAEMNIPVYKKGDSSSVPVDASITPHLVMVMDRLTGHSIDCWLEWIDPHTHLCIKQERDRSIIRDFILEQWKASDHPPAKSRRKQRKMDRSEGKIAVRAPAILALPAIARSMSQWHAELTKDSYALFLGAYGRTVVR